MTIEFVPLDFVSVQGTARSTVMLRARGVGPGLAGNGSAQLKLGSAGVAHVRFGGGVDPVVPAHGSAALLLRAEGVGSTHLAGEGGVSIELRAAGFQATPGHGGGAAKLALNARGRQLTGPMAFAGLEANPRMISAFGGLWFVSPRAAIAVSQVPSTLPTHVLSEAITVAAGRRSSQSSKSSVSDALSLEEAAAIVYQLLVDEGVMFAPALKATVSKLERVLDRLLLLGACQSYADAVNAIAGGLWFGALTEALKSERVVESLITSEVVGTLQRAADRLAESMLINADTFGSGTGVVLVNERALIATGEVSVAEALQHLGDSIGFVTRLALDTGEYVAWVLNTENRALSRYTDYPFNSFAKIGGRYYGAAANGLHRLEGNDDDGEPIAARIRLGLSALGTRRLKRVPEAFVGYTSDGVLLLHVITVNEESGQKEAAIYKILERPATSTRETRWKLGKGIKAVDFDFIIENVDGADFDLAAIDFRPIYLERRTRG
ncbi:hypothetical protein [Stenotrophomonas maltophilia]|uniref:hypothetical protein n=1 Tax=Stenotrophomonas maltophilia TaxID=40324 RepID=UPI0015DED6B4|nr:hypothetical protein [Stenotrophomonas maltophilia]MBA0361100.1 hypothetical protein [Stenotrophomonas maltophilia]HEL5043011.1 hypothetical protein [Stenotrophomonas maltophilia]